jgi:low affinity Fe/Cu permease
MLTVVIVWAISGPYFRFSDTWQLVINTGTTVITFLMVFLIQNTQNRDTLEMRLKLDELIRSQQGGQQRLHPSSPAGCRSSEKQSSGS